MSKKDYSEKEIIEKFPSLSPSILNRLKKLKLIDDYKLANEIIEKLKDKGKGYYYILACLERRKIKKEIIENFKRFYDFDEEFERCKKIIEKLKEKKTYGSILLYLKNRGFSENTIEKIEEYLSEIS
ncbi:MAG: hypothetical protein ACP5OB_04140 [Candidatus Ratteibacteria bacterium]